MSPQIVRGWEHQSLEHSGNKSADLDKIKKHFSEISSKDKESETLGLHKVGNDIRPGNYIGVVWIGEGDNRVVLRVDSKFKNPTLDYMTMFAECCAHPIVGEEMQGCFHFWSEHELIDIPNTDDFSFMVVVAFLQELNVLCVRHLRRHFHRQRDNFIGKVKGKILISENVRRNVGHAERMFCEYQTISDDILENRILRAALEKAARYLSTYMVKMKMPTNQEESETYSILQRWIHACRTHLRGVSVVHIARRDFNVVRSRGAFAPYRSPLSFAKAVLHRLGFNPHAETSKSAKTVPYCIDSAKLFERYTELQLRKQYKNIIALHDGKDISGKNPGFNVSVRPDFYMPRQARETPLIIDAKYKKFKRSPPNSDLYQVVAYLQHFGLLDKINAKHDNKEDGNDIELRLAYPSLEGIPWKNPDFTDAFKSKVHLHEIKCPIVPPDSKPTDN